jgi:hypothetical protein
LIPVYRYMDKHYNTQIALAHPVSVIHTRKIFGDSRAEKDRWKIRCIQVWKETHRTTSQQAWIQQVFEEKRRRRGYYQRRQVCRDGITDHLQNHVPIYTMYATICKHTVLRLIRPGGVASHPICGDGDARKWFPPLRGNGFLPCEEMVSSPARKWLPPLRGNGFPLCGDSVSPYAATVCRPMRRRCVALCGDGVSPYAATVCRR